METETKVGLRPCTLPADRLSAWVEDQDGRRVVAILSMAELRGLVQAAYDAHGILADPSFERECQRMSDAEADEFLAHSERVNLTHNAGVRA